MIADDRIIDDATSRNLSAELVGLAYTLRNLLKDAWSVDTAHPSERRSQDGSSYGQCYVSSMALFEEIDDTFPDVEAWICRGRLTRDDEVLIEDHGWITAVVPDGNHLVIDLTADQAAGANLPEVVAIFSDAAVEASVCYEEFERRHILEVSNHDTWVRYWLLSARCFTPASPGMVDA